MFINHRVTQRIYFIETQMNTDLRKEKIKIICANLRSSAFQKEKNSETLCHSVVKFFSQQSQRYLFREEETNKIRALFV